MFLGAREARPQQVFLRLEAGTCVTAPSSVQDGFEDQLV